jgi:lysyl-tRNA synthetase class 2
MREFTEQELVRRKKAEELAKKGIDPFGHRFDITSNSKEIKETYEEHTQDDLHDKEIPVKIAGRIMTKRGKGKAGFMHIQDNFGQIQIYVRLDIVGEEQYELFDNADLGDIVGIEGNVFRTNMGELSVKATKYTHLAKALKPLPEKYHGISDPEIKLRKRYLDIIMDPEIKELFRRKQQFWATIRNYLIENGFLEVETPILENSAGGAAATPFSTHHNALDLDVFLRISMGELWQKKLLVAGYEKTFEIGRQFRNEGMSPEHLQDYTQMEFYWAYADYKDGMEFVKEMYRRVTKNVLGTSKFTSKGYEIDMDAEWEIYDFETIIKKGTGVSIYEATKEDVINGLKEAGVEFDPSAPYWRLVDTLWKVVRKTLSGPGFLVGQPVELNPLPKRLKDDPRKVAQFQVILAGSEMGNGYTELNDAIDLEARFKEQRDMAEAGDEEAHEHDAEFIEALEYGMPPAFGFGVSERLFSTLMDRPIRECVMFPLMKPINSNEK